MTEVLNEKGPATRPGDEAIALNDDSIVSKGDDSAGGSPEINPAFSYIQLHPQGKVPTPDMADWTVRSRRPMADVREWVAQGFNLGVRCDAQSGVWVLDVDVDPQTGRPSDEWLALVAEHSEPETYTVATPAGGRHYYFRPPVDLEVRNDQSGLVAEDVDIRGTGGYVVAPGFRAVYDKKGVHFDGTYDVVNDAAIAQSPAWLVERLVEREEAKAARAQRLNGGEVLPKAEVIDPEWDRLAREELNGLFAKAEVLAGLAEGETLEILGERRGWERGSGFFTLACKIVEVARWPHTQVTVEQAHEAWAERVPAKYAQHDWANALESAPRTWEWGDRQVAPSFDDLTAGLPSRNEPVATSRGEQVPAATGSLRDRLDHLSATCAKWFGPRYDMASMNAVVAARAAHELDGIPVWLQILSGPGNAKTETVMSLAATNFDGKGDHWSRVQVASDITGPAALLSGSPKKDTAKDATGGMLEELGNSGVLVLKDFTTILSMNRDTRATVLAALREVYDGTYVRNLGTDGGKTLRWDGRLTLISATTSAYDTHYGAITAMGDRFAVVRVDSDSRGARKAVARQAHLNSGKEKQMREEMSKAVAAVVAHMDKSAAVIDPDDETALVLVDLADVVTKIRTNVNFDRSGRWADSADSAEVGTRFGKVLLQVYRGGLSVGMTKQEALNLARRVGLDSCQPQRVECLRALANGQPRTVDDVARVLDLPKATVGRNLGALHLLGILKSRKVEAGMDEHGMFRANSTIYSLSDEWSDVPEVLGLDSTGAVS